MNGYTILSQIFNNFEIMIQRLFNEEIYKKSVFFFFRGKGTNQLTHVSEHIKSSFNKIISLCTFSFNKLNYLLFQTGGGKKKLPCIHLGLKKYLQRF